MADIRNIRSRPGVRIYLHSFDLADMITQPDVVASMDDDQITNILFAYAEEQQKRGKEAKYEDTLPF